MHDVFLGLGSNLGDRLANLRSAIATLSSHGTVKKLSSLYESVPHGVAGEQPLYVNMVAHITTDLVPVDLLTEIKLIERTMGRVANSHREPRPIDIDILLYGDQHIEIPGLAIPHREMHTRHFVLVPLEEIASFQMHPVLKKPIIDLLDNLGAHDTLLWRAAEQL